MAKFTAAAPERVQRAAGSHPRVSGQLFGFTSAPFPLKKKKKEEKKGIFEPLQPSLSWLCVKIKRKSDGRTPPAVFRVCSHQTGSVFITNLSQMIKYCGDPDTMMYVSSESETNALLMTALMTYL